MKVRVTKRLARGLALCKFLGYAFVFFLLHAAVNSQADSGIKLKPISIYALDEFGIMSKGYFGNTAFQNEWVDHAGAFITQSASVTERLTFDVGLGGLFQFQKPEVRTTQWGGSQFRDFYVGPSVADLQYVLGEIEHPYASVQFGMFPYKYGYSSNLGEYMFRSGPYPTVMTTGGYSMVNNATAYLQGLRLGFTGIKNLSLDLLLNTETNLAPLYDFTLTGIAKYSVGGGMLEIGAGVQLKRLIQIHPDSTSRKSASNSYFDKNGVTYVGRQDYYAFQSKYWKRVADAEMLNGNTAAYQADSMQAATLKATADSVGVWYNDPAVPKEYYTTAGTVLMGMMSFDPKKLFSSEMLGENDLKLYAEIAVLGIENYPVYYRKISERMPVTVGFNLPGFKVLDLISIECEYFNSPWINSYASLSAIEATPDIPDGQIPWSSQNGYNDIADKDNISWSLLVKKQIAHSITISGQVARDHARMVSRTNWFGPGLDPNEALTTSKDWYWMLQFAFGI